MNTLCIPLLNAGEQFFLTIDKIDPINSPHQHRLASSRDEPVTSVYERIYNTASARFRCVRV